MRVFGIVFCFVAYANRTRPYAKLPYLLAVWVRRFYVVVFPIISVYITALHTFVDVFGQRRDFSIVKCDTRFFVVRAILRDL